MEITSSKKEQIAVLTGGGDAPGLNAVIRGFTTKAKKNGYDVLGLCDGWAGVLDGGKVKPLDLDEVEDIHMMGGTILGSSRTNPYKVENGAEQVKRNLKKLNCKYLVAIGGEDTLGVAAKLYKDGIKVVGVPKTIDNDLSETDYTFGFDTAITRASEAIRNLHTTAQSHHRVIIVEVMGRHVGWMALEAGIAGGAHAILVPEENFAPANFNGRIEMERNCHRITALDDGFGVGIPIKNFIDIIFRERRIDGRLNCPITQA
jgi:6-phosphofructokinase 1